VAAVPRALICGFALPTIQARCDGITERRGSFLDAQQVVGRRALIRRMPREVALAPARSSRYREGPACWVSGKTTAWDKALRCKMGRRYWVFGTAPCMIDMDTLGIRGSGRNPTSRQLSRLHFEMSCSELSAVAHAAGAAPRTRWPAFTQRDSGCMPTSPSHGGAVLLGLQTIRCKRRCMLYGLCRKLRSSGVSGGVEL
jgi:hypothetical protein